MSIRNFETFNVYVFNNSDHTQRPLFVARDYGSYEDMIKGAREKVEELKDASNRITSLYLDIDHKRLIFYLTESWWTL